MATESKIIKMIINAENKASRVFSDVDKSIGTLDSSFGGLGGRAARLTKSIGLVTAAMGAMAATFATFAVREAADFETAIANISTLLWGEQQKDLPAIQEGIMGITRVVPQSATVLSDAFYKIQSGLGTGAKGLGVLEIAAKAAVGGVTDAATSAGALVTVMNAYEMSADKASYANDVMFAGVKAGQLEYKDLAAGIGEIALPGKEANQSLEQIIATMATLTGAIGGDPAEQFTMAKRLFQKLQLPGVQKKFRDLGVEILDVNGKLLAEDKILKRLNEEGFDFARIMEAIPMAKPAMGLAILVKKYDTFIEHLDTANEAMGAGEKAFDKQMATFNKKVELAKNAWKELLVVIGDPIKENLKPLIDEITKKLHALSDWEKESGAISGIFTTWVSALTQVVGILPGILDDLVDIETQSGFAGGGFIDWAGDVETAKGALYGTSVVVGGLALGVALVHDAIVALLKSTVLLTGSLAASLTVTKWMLKGLDVVWGWDMSGMVKSIADVEKMAYDLTKKTWNADYLSDDVVGAIAKIQRGIEGITDKSENPAKKLAESMEKVADAGAGKTPDIVTGMIEDLNKADRAVAKLKESIGGLSEAHGVVSTSMASMFDSLAKALSSKDMDFMGKVTIESAYEKTTKPWLEMQEKLVDAQVGYIDHLKSGGGLDINIKSEGGPAWLSGLTDDLLEKVVIKASGEGVKALVGIS